MGGTHWGLDGRAVGWPLGTWAVVSLAGTGIELTLQIQDAVGVKATLKEFMEKLAGAEEHQQAVAALRGSSFQEPDPQVVRRSTGGQQAEGMQL